ncbi:MAG: hypothetical protein KDB14_06215 [Planctomycetales bacterium]|nr:hypothetical protein [Planctomycetales bacterium]
MVVKRSNSHVKQSYLVSHPKFTVTRTAHGTIREFVHYDGATYREYTSETSLFGLPMLQIIRGINPETGKREVARGVVAIGQFAVGGIAIGQMAQGYIGIGQLATGRILAIGQLAVAPLALGQMTLAVAAVGQMVFALAGIGQGGWVSLGFLMSSLTGG